MGDYSPEPPRRNCVLHLSFNNVNDGNAIDVSPQENDGTISGDYEEVTGAVGGGIRFNESGVTLVPNDPNVTDPQDRVTASVFVREPVVEKAQSLFSHDGRWDIEVTDTQQLAVSVEFTDSTTANPSVLDLSDYDDWPLHIGLVYERTTGLFVYANGEPVYVDRSLDGKQIVDSGGDIRVSEDSTAAADRRAVATIDRPQIYDTSLDETAVANIAAIGREHNSLNAVRDAWDNAGIPLRGTNSELAATLAEEKDAVMRQLDYIREARHIDDAAGRQLDRIGATAGVRRREDESDAKYRARIIATFAAGRSSGTFEDIITATANILDTDIERVEAQTNFNSDPATAFVYIRTADIDDTPLTNADITEVLKDVVLAGHDVEVIEQGAEPFTLIDDADANDPELGLTSDSISTGGGLTSDV